MKFFAMQSSHTVAEELFAAAGCCFLKTLSLLILNGFGNSLDASFYAENHDFKNVND